MSLFSFSSGSEEKKKENLLPDLGSYMPDFGLIGSRAANIGATHRETGSWAIGDALDSLGTGSYGVKSIFSKD